MCVCVRVNLAVVCFRLFIQHLCLDVLQREQVQSDSELPLFELCVRVHVCVVEFAIHWVKKFSFC